MVEKMSLNDRKLLKKTKSDFKKSVKEGHPDWTEIETIYGQLEGAIGMKIEPAPDNWDRAYSVDFFVQVGEKYIGIQIKPIESGQALNQYQWIEMHKVNHENFEKKFGGKVFFVYSTKVGGKKKIYNTEVIEQIITEIVRLKK